MAQVERPNLEYKNTSLRFRLTADDQIDAFSRQYYQMYKVRLGELRKRVLQAAKDDGNYEYKPLEALQEDEKCLIIGTIIKRIGLRPSVLKDLAQDEHLIPEDDMPEVEDGVDGIQSLVSNKDYLEIEDDKQIIKLGGNISMDEVATGCVIGAIGYKREDTFFVNGIVMPAVSPQAKWPTTKPNAVIAILSGLELTGIPMPDKEVAAAFALFTRWINGEMMADAKEKDLASRVERVIIAGDSLAFQAGKDISSAARVLRLIPNGSSSPVEAAEKLDHLLCNLTSKMRVDVVPGSGDPCPQLWPQQPIHRALLPLAGNSGQALGLRSNPYSFILGGIEFLTTSGLNVTDIMRMSNVQNSLDVMESILKWQHIAPTSPDTIDGFPMNDRDPLIMEHRPHVFICGNQLKPDSRWSKIAQEETLLIGIPRFSRTHLVTFLDLHTMEVSHKYFGTC